MFQAHGRIPAAPRAQSGGRAAVALRRAGYRRLRGRRQAPRGRARGSQPLGPRQVAHGRPHRSTADRAAAAPPRLGREATAEAPVAHQAAHRAGLPASEARLRAPAAGSAEAHARRRHGRSAAAPRAERGRPQAAHAAARPSGVAHGTRSLAVAALTPGLLFSNPKMSLKK